MEMGMGTGVEMEVGTGMGIGTEVEMVVEMEMGMRILVGTRVPDWGSHGEVWVLGWRSPTGDRGAGLGSVGR